MHGADTCEPLGVLQDPRPEHDEPPFGSVVGPPLQAVDVLVILEPETQRYFPGLVHVSPHHVRGSQREALKRRYIIEVDQARPCFQGDERVLGAEIGEFALGLLSEMIRRWQSVLFDPVGR